MTNKKSELKSEVALLLWRNWDPIGVYEESSEADDEYNSYVPNLVKLLIEGADAHKLSKYLTQCRTISMGMSDSNKAQKHDRKIALKAIDLRIKFLG